MTVSPVRQRDISAKLAIAKYDIRVERFRSAKVELLCGNMRYISVFSKASSISFMKVWIIFK